MKFHYVIGVIFECILLASFSLKIFCERPVVVEGTHKSKTETLVVVINAPSQDNVKKQSLTP